MTLPRQSRQFLPQKNENAVIKMADKIPPIPCGIKPALLYKLATPLTFFAKGQIPEIAKIPIMINPIMATHFD